MIDYGKRKPMNAYPDRRPDVRADSPKRSGKLAGRRLPARAKVASSAGEPIDENALRFVPLGGLDEIGRNMAYFEYKDEILVIDMGLQFPEEETPGIDYIIPNIASLEPKKRNIKGIILTHAHYDHIGAVPYLSGRLGNPPIYTTKLTKAIVERRQEEFTNAPKLNIITVNEKDKVKIGEYFDLEFFNVPHTVPDNIGTVIKTPIGNLVHFSDFRFEYNEKDEPQGIEEFRRIGDLGIHSFMIDSTNAETEGHSLSEKVVKENLEKLFANAKGRVILATFSSMISRLGEIIEIAERLNRKVVVVGRSMKDNLEIAQNLGYLKFKKGLVISADEIKKYKDDKIMILTTGAQGEKTAGLMKIINGDNKDIQIKAGDTIVFSSSVIPGNEASVQVLKDNLARQGAIVYHSKIIDIHASGHAPREDLILAMKLVRPRFVAPVHGYFFMRATNAQNAAVAGVKPENVRLMDNGQVASLTENDFVITKETVPAFYIMVDGLGVGDVGEVVLRDRRVLAQEGMVVLIVTLDKQTGRVLKNPDIISRGFIYLKENQEMLDEMRRRIRNIVSRIPRREQEVDYLKTIFRDQVAEYLYRKTNRRPMVLPVVIEV